MFKWVGKLFGTDKAAASLIDNVSNGIDKIWYTDEEKSQDVIAAKKHANDVYMKWLEGTSGSRLARRFIAIAVTVVWVAQYVFSLALSAIAPWTDPETTKLLMESANILSQNGQQGDGAFMVVLGFYFLGTKGDTLFKAAVDKFTNKNHNNKKD